MGIFNFDFSMRNKSSNPLKRSETLLKNSISTYINLSLEINSIALELEQGKKDEKLIREYNLTIETISQVITTYLQTLFVSKNNGKLFDSLEQELYSKAQSLKIIDEKIPNVNNSISKQQLVIIGKKRKDSLLKITRIKEILELKKRQN